MRRNEGSPRSLVWGWALVLGLSLGGAEGASHWIEVAEGEAAPGQRNQFAMTYDEVLGRVLLFGGCCGPEGEFGDTWGWNGSSWRKLAVDGPPARNLHALAYDRGRGRAVLFGGWSGEDSLGDTWEWDGESWVELDAEGPFARTKHAMAYDEHRGVTVLYGGYSRGYLYDTWEWDGVEWRFRSDVGPTAVKQFAMAYDVARRTTVLFGGRDEDDDRLGETWGWDGTGWTLLAEDGPWPSDSAHGLTYDRERERIVLYGGKCNSGQCGYDQGRLDETWEWDGSEWTEVDVAAEDRATIRSGHSVVYDVQRKVVVTFGGHHAGEEFDDTWEFVPDHDDDGIADALDNCRDVANADQLDTDRDSLGDACDTLHDDYVVRATSDRVATEAGLPVGFVLDLVNNTDRTLTGVWGILYERPLGGERPWPVERTCLATQPVSVTLEAGEATEWPCAVSFPPGVPPGSYEAVIRLQELGGETIGEARLGLDVHP